MQKKEAISRASLFVQPAINNLQKFKLAQTAIEQTFPLKRQHRAELRYATRDLSRLLTTERSSKLAYWASPRLLGAYLYYFLPWNLIRLSWLLPQLPLKLESGATLLDLGSGPLTLPLAMWISCPELRAAQLTLHCTDSAPRPLELGRNILESLSMLSASSSQNVKQTLNWKTKTFRLPLSAALRKFSEPVQLITAANVLNELPTPRQESLEEKLTGIFMQMDKALLPGGQILIIEPGNRLGGRIISIIRQIALKNGFVIEAPCTHNSLCPLAPLAYLEEQYDPVADGYQITGRKGSTRNNEAKNINRGKWQPDTWCHFSYPARGVWPELAKLSAEAGLEKERLHLSFILLRKAEKGRQAAEKQNPNGLPVRIISEALRIPGLREHARYACSENGLALLHQAEHFTSGTLIIAQKPKTIRRDKKTGAIELTPINLTDKFMPEIK